MKQISKLPWLSLGARPLAKSFLESCSAGQTHPPFQRLLTTVDNGREWRFMVEQGHKLNPCNSPLHPAVVEAGLTPEGSEEVCVQEAYTPQSDCFGCGPAHPTGLHLKSFRVDNGLEARVSIPSTYTAFPGIVNGGIISTLMDCHANWTAAIALMDKGFLPKPPLTLTASMYVVYKEPTPPDTPLVLRSTVAAIKEQPHPGLGKARVEVDVRLYLEGTPGEPQSDKLLAEASGVFKRLGALRAL